MKGSFQGELLTTISPPPFPKIDKTKEKVIVGRRAARFGEQEAAARPKWPQLLANAWPKINSAGQGQKCQLAAVGCDKKPAGKRRKRKTEEGTRQMRRWKERKEGLNPNLFSFGRFGYSAVCILCDQLVRGRFRCLKPKRRKLPLDTKATDSLQRPILDFLVSDYLPPTRYRNEHVCLQSVSHAFQIIFLTVTCSCSAAGSKSRTEADDKLVFRSIDTFLQFAKQERK